MSGRHGVFIQEEASQVYTMVNVDSALPVVIGTAPVHTLPQGVQRPVNQPLLIASPEEFAAQLGSVPAGEDVGSYTLAEFADVYMGLYGVAPIVFINVFDPAKHTRPVQGGDGNQTDPDVSKVTSADIIGGIDGDTMRRKGLELAASVFPRFTMVPGQLLAPGFSSDPAVALVMGAKCSDINGHFSCTAPIDVPAEVRNYTEVPAWIQDNNLTDKHLIPFFGRPIIGGKIMWGSTHLAGATGLRDANNDGVPFWSPSNSRILANGIMHNGELLDLDTEQAGWLNFRGCVTGINFVGGLKVWGNYTAAYPGVTDVKDVFIPIRRMFSYVGNTLVLSTWQKVDEPIVRVRHIESIVDSTNQWLNGLVRRERLIGGKVSFLAGDNAVTDLMNGTVRYRIALTPPSPAQEIVHILRYDHTALSSLFSSVSAQ